MPSPNKNEGKGAVFVYRDTKTGEFYYFSRRGTHKKNGRILVFVEQSKGEGVSTDHILNRTSRSLADEKAGYPPNCNEGYVEKGGDCVPKEEDN
jgi:hypothetical protein